VVEITRRELKKLVQEELQRRKVQQEENVSTGVGSILTPKAFVKKKKY